MHASLWLARALVADWLGAALRSGRDLPQDARGLVVIMAEIGRGGLNGAVITIEEARGQLAGAVEDLAEPSLSPAPAP